MSDRRNLLVVMSDEHAYWASGAYGHPFIETPNLDRIAERGVTFDSAYCNSPLCAPSRYSFLAGRLPHRIAAWNNYFPLASDIPTWAHYLSIGGYQTALAGKQHFAGPDQHHGFEVRLGDEIHTTRIRPFGQVQRPDPERHFSVTVGRGEYIDYDYEMVDRAIAYLSEERDSSRPFALCLSLFAPHFPFTVEEQYFERYWPEHGDLPEVPDGVVEGLHPAWQSRRDFYRVAELSDDQVRRVRAAYYALATFLDAQIGRVLEALEQLGLLDDTIVVYTSDHGEHLGSHGLWHKKTFLEDSVRVPLIIAHPDGERGTRRETPVSLVDVAATIVEWAGQPPPPDFDGESLDALLRDPNAPRVPEVIAELVGTHERVTMPEVPVAASPWRMLRDERYKLNYFHGSAPELYDLAADPDELHDLSRDPSHAPVLQQMTRRVLADWDPVAVDGAVEEAMRRARVVMDAETSYLGPPPVAKSLGGGMATRH